jgi:hypothetical protein
VNTLVSDFESEPLTRSIGIERVTVILIFARFAEDNII